jgi:predicted phage terminase large subunit-like protein
LHNWHIDLIADRLQQVSVGKIRRLIINMPPRSLKSVCISVAWPAWLLGNNPAARIMAASYSASLSVKHSVDSRLVLGQEWYAEVFPGTVITDDQNEKAKFVTTKRGFRFATSVGGTATGEGADILIVDDPHNPIQAASQLQRQHAIDWFDQTFSTRLNNKKKGAIVVVMQRLHVDDLTGHLLKKGGWEHLCLSAVFDRNMVYHYAGINKLVNSGDYLHEGREGEAEIANAKRELGSYGFNAQYQQQPMPLKGGMVELAWIKRYESAVAVAQGMGENMDGLALSRFPHPCAINPKPLIVQSWDTAIKSGSGNDYSVCTTWVETENAYYLLDVVALRLEYPALKSTCIALAEKWEPNTILIEDKASGQSLLQDLRLAKKFPVIAITPNADKITRFARVTTLFEGGKIYLPKQAAWLADYEAELLGFPNITHDDMVDSTSQFLNWARQRGGFGPRIREF